MAKYQLTKLAVNDLSEIWEYTYETWSEGQADKYYNLLLNAFESLAKNQSKEKSMMKSVMKFYAKEFQDTLFFIEN